MHCAKLLKLSLFGMQLDFAGLINTSSLHKELPEDNLANPVYS